MKEPVITAGAIQALIVAGINLVVSFGWVTVTDAQMSSVNAFLAMLLPLIFAVLVRANVTPVANPGLPAGTTVRLPDGTSGTVTQA